MLHEKRQTRPQNAVGSEFLTVGSVTQKARSHLRPNAIRRQRGTVKLNDVWLIV